MRVKLHLPDSRRVIFSFMMALLLLKMPGTGSKFSGSCYAQQPLQVKEQYLQEVNELFARAKAEQVDIYSPKTFTNARELYQTIISDIEKGDRVEITLRNLNQAKMLLYTALETAHNIKLTLKDLIVLREEARGFPAGQKQSREAFFRAEEAFQYAVLQLEERIERNAQRAVLEAEVSYREVILISLREESLRKATQKLDELQRTISSQNYMELATNLEMAEDLLLQAQTPGIITSDFLSLVEKIKARIQLILNYSVKQDIITELPDLTIEEIDINPTRPHVGENINIRAVVKNLGMAPVSKSLIIFLICGEHELTYTFSRHLGSGQSEELHITTIMPDLDECLITALIDPENRIQESDEQNNRAQLNVTTDAESFTFEEYPEWQMSDLAVIDLTVSPERSNPGDAVKLEATLQNKWKGDTESTSIIFLVDGVMINQVIIPSLAAGAQTKVNTIWKPEAPGQHCITARLKSEEDYVDFNFANNSQIAQAFVSGENNPEPVLSFKEPNFDDLLLQPSESYRLSLKVRNPSFAHIRNIPFIYYIDGERTSAGMIEYLPPGEEQDLQIPWNNVAPGQHIITIKLDLPEDFTNVEFQSLKSWSVVVPDKTVLYTGTRKKHKWFSMGPNILNLKTDTNDMIPDGSTGRMDRIAFHPTNPDILWALAPSGGLWKSENRGDDWKPISDGLPSLIVHAVAIDPKIPDIIYLATRDGYDGQGKGIFKTIDGGASPWVQFAMKNLVGNVNEMVIRYTSSGQVMLYATSDNGVWRYLSNNPKAKQSVTTDWLRIKSGEVVDFAVHPTDHSLVYATVGHREWRGGSYVFVMDGLYRTKKGETAINDNDWERLTQGFPNIDGLRGYLHLDIYKSSPNILYASITNPPGHNNMLGIYRSLTSGDTWDHMRNVNLSSYNDFIRVHPSDFRFVYYGGIKLYKVFIDPGSPAEPPIQIKGVHDDMKSLEFDPFAPDHYYSLNDGGVWYCKVQAKGISDICKHRNKNLRTVQFFDFDASRIDQNVMLGGTQDNGTMLYTGSPDWDVVLGGDGLFALIASDDNKIFYAQHQFLDDTKRCDKGGKCRAGENWHQDWYAANAGLPHYQGEGNAYITVHPNNSDYLLAQGPEVYFTKDAGKKWELKGPKGSGDVIRVVFQPSTYYWIAGTSTGQIQYTKDEGKNWHLLFKHPNGASVKCLSIAPTDNNVLYAIFNARGDWWAYTRIYRIHLNIGTSQNAVAAIMGAGFPKNLTPKCITGDGHNINFAYVGTNQGGVYRWDATQPFWGGKPWQSYNDGLPLTVDVRDLLVDPTSKELRAATWGRGAWRVITGPSSN